MEGRGGVRAKMDRGREGGGDGEEGTGGRWEVEDREWNVFIWSACLIFYSFVQCSRSVGYLVGRRMYIHVAS